MHVEGSKTVMGGFSSIEGSNPSPSVISADSAFLQVVVARSDPGRRLPRDRLGPLATARFGKELAQNWRENREVG